MKFIYKSQTIFFLIFSIFFSLVSYSATVGDEQPIAQVSSGQDDFWVLYEGQKLKSDLFNDHSKESLMILIYKYQEEKASTSASKLNNSIVIPFGPTLNLSNFEDEIVGKNRIHHAYLLNKRDVDKDLLKMVQDNLNSLTEEELKIFLSKKQDFLNTISESLLSFFSKFKLKPYRLINRIIATINNSMYLGAKKFVSSNTVAYPVYINLGIGASWSRLVYDLFFRSKAVKDHPHRDLGIYLAGALGFTISITKENGRKIKSLDFFFDRESFMSTITPFAELHGGVGSGVYFESRKIINPQPDNSTSIDKSDDISDNSRFKTTKSKITSDPDSYQSLKELGPLKIISGANNFGVNISIIGASFPFPSIFKDTTLRRSYYHVTISDSENLNSFAQKMKRLLLSLGIRSPQYFCKIHYRK